MEKCRRVLGEEHPNTLITTINTGGVLQAQGRNAEAVKLLDGVELAARKAFTGANVRWVAKLLRDGARPGRPSAPRRCREGSPRGPPALRPSRGERHKETRECAQALVDLYKARQAAEPGRGYDLKAAAWAAKLRLSSAS